MASYTWTIWSTEDRASVWGEKQASASESGALHDTPIRLRQRLGLLGLPGVVGVSDAASQQVTQMPGTGEGGVAGR